MNSQKNNFHYLNADNQWPDHHLHDMEIAADGALQLRGVPRLIGAPPAGVTQLPIPDGVAGITCLPDGTILLSDPQNHNIWKVSPCESSAPPKVVPCVGAEGSLPTQFRQPRGLLYVPRRGLFVADSGNHRVQIFTIDTWQLLEIWGTTGEFEEPARGLFDRPVGLAADGKGHVYVLSLAGKRVQKLNQFGRLDDSFWQNIAGHNVLSEPVAITVATVQEKEQLLILDRERRQVFAFSLDGTTCISCVNTEMQNPSALAVTAKAIYVGDNQRRVVLQFDHDGKFVGEAVGYRGPVAVLTLGNKTHLLVHPGEVSKWTRLAIDAGHLHAGFFWIGPLDHQARPVRWHHFVANVEGLRERVHVKFFTFTSNDPHAIVDSNVAEVFFKDWQGQPRDVGNGFIALEQSLYLWVGGLLTGDGTATPRLSQIRVDLDDTWLRHLPAFYAENQASRDFLVPFLALFESFFEELETDIRRLPARFDPATTPVEFLPWLASWLAIELEEAWPETKKRQVIAEAFQNYAWRGTAQGLRKSLKIYAGVKAHIIEPILHFHLWSLGETSTLGVDTMLASAHPQGAVVGTTATLDQSHLIAGDQYGAPLFEEVAHQFVVQVYRRDANTPDKLAAIRRVIDREKPAHAAYQLHIIDPRMQVGLQAQVGIDTVIAGPPRALRLDEEFRVKQSLAGYAIGRIGMRCQIGITTRLC